VIAAVHFTLRVPFGHEELRDNFHSLVATAFFTWINFNSIAFCVSLSWTSTTVTIK